MVKEVEINSIINENSILSEVTDTIKPYTFIEYISKADLLNTENNFLVDYKSYIEKWVQVKNSNAIELETKEIIKNEIITLLKVIVISYSSYEEQLFLSNLNWDFKNIEDPEEREKAKNSIFAALPIFVSKIKEIVQFYNKKRTEATFVIERNKIRGSQSSIEKIIFDNIIDYIFNNTDQSISTNKVKNYLGINIERYIDTYSEYFDVDRAKAETLDYNDIDASLYFDLGDVLSKMLFDGDVYLREIPLIAQLSIDLNDECVGDKLDLKNKLLADSQLSLLTNDEKVLLRKQLYQKYLGVDFYYYYKSLQGNVQSGIFIKADNPTNNLLNQQTADTPYTESKQLELLKNIGLFFKPDKMSILRINTNNYEYVIDEDKVKPGQVYIFPDPNVYGNVAFNNRADYPYIIQYSIDEYIKSYDYGWAKHDPKVLNYQQPIFPYYSKEQDLDKFNKNKKVKLAFEDLYNRGFISTYKEDLYGNKFAMFKDQCGKYSRNWNIKFFDPQDYNGDPGDPGSGDSGSEDGGSPSESVISYLSVDGGTLGDTAQGVNKGISADKITWTEDNHYYDYLIEAGLSTKTPDYFRAYIPNGAVRGNGDARLKINESDDYVYIIDGDHIDTNYSDFDTDSVNDDIDKIYGLNPIYKSNLLHNNCKNPNLEEDQAKNYYELEKTRGDIYITSPNNKSKLLIDALPWWKSSNNKDIYQFFIDNATDFDIIEDILWIKAINPETGSIHYMFEGIVFDPKTNTFNKKFTNKETIFFTQEGNAADSYNYSAFNYKQFEQASPSYFGGNNNIYDYGSNIFYVENKHKIYFAVMTVDTSSAGSYPIYYPNIYCIDIINYKVYNYTFEQVEAAEAQKIESFKIPGVDNNGNPTLIHKASKPYLTYSNNNDTFMLTYIAYDTDSSTYIYKHFFQVSNPINDYSGYIEYETLDSTVYGPTDTSEITIIAFDTNLVLN